LDYKPGFAMADRGMLSLCSGIDQAAIKNSDRGILIFWQALYKHFGRQEIELPAFILSTVKDLGFVVSDAVRD
jgi:hypothetical protein